MKSAIQDNGPASIGANRRALISADRLVTRFPISSRGLRRTVAYLTAVDGVSLEIMPGETVGLVGESGCGKSSLGRTLLRLIDPFQGTIIFDGVEITKLGQRRLKEKRRQMQLIFQDPVGSLNPRMTVMQIIAEGLIAHSVGDRQDREQRVRNILEAVGLDPSVASRRPHEFSGGQRQRIGIARALVLSPRFVVADEPVSALDVSIQSQILNLLAELRTSFSLTYLFIAHNLAVVDYISDRVAVMYLGKIVELSEAAELRTEPLHPYTVALLSAIPESVPDSNKRRIVLAGEAPSPMSPPAGCRFSTRCPIVRPVCVDIEPPLEEKQPGHFVACHFFGEMR